MSSTDLFDPNKYLDSRGMFTTANPAYDCSTEHIIPKLLCSPTSVLPTPPSPCASTDSPPDLEVDAMLKFLTTDLVEPSAPAQPDEKEPATTGNPGGQKKDEQENAESCDSPSPMNMKKRSRFSFQSLVSKRNINGSKEALVTCIEEPSEVSDSAAKTSSDTLDSYNTSPNGSGSFSTSNSLADSATSQELDAPPVPAKPSKNVQDRAQDLRKQLQAPTTIAEKAQERPVPSPTKSAPQAEPKSSPSLKRRNKRQSYNDHRLSIFSVASSMAALAPFIGIRGSEDTKPIVETSPDSVDAEVESFYKRFNDIEEPQVKPKKTNKQQRRKSSLPMETVPEYVSRPLVRPPDTSAAFVSNLVENLSHELDQRFKCVDSDLRESPEFNWRPQTPEKVEHRSHFRRILGWCKNQRLHFSKTSWEHRPGHFWSYSLKRSQTVPHSRAVPFDIHLQTPPALDSPALGDMGSPPLSLRVQTEPAKIAQGTL